MALCSGPCPPALALPYVPLQSSAWGQMVAKLTRGRMFADITPGRTTRPTPLLGIPLPRSLEAASDGASRARGGSCWGRVCFSITRRKLLLLLQMGPPWLVQSVRYV